jgi:hypothetical protein
LITLYFLFAE